MRNKDALEGLAAYLRDLGVILGEAEAVCSREFETRIDDELQATAPSM